MVYDPFLINSNAIDAYGRDVWVFGDVHGCARQLEELLCKIYDRSKNPIIISTGDLIDRGPDLYDVFQVLDACDVYTCIGNHELNFIQEHFGYKPCNSHARRETHEQFKRLSNGDQEFIIKQMMKMRNYIVVDKEDASWLVSHAPVRAIEETPTTLGASNYCMGTVPYTDRPMTYAVHGHMHWDYKPIKEQIDNSVSKCFNVDAGCVYGKELLALNLHDLSYIEVSNPIEYSKT